MTTARSKRYHENTLQSVSFQQETRSAGQFEFDCDRLIERLEGLILLTSDRKLHDLVLRLRRLARLTEIEMRKRQSETSDPAMHDVSVVTVTNPKA